ncbi:MAG: hypothetical protein R3B51_13195 [Thermodesulfobacteriota bacterium]
MEGKGAWSKGVCLTLLDIAKRERRKAAIIVFSSGGQPGKLFETDPREGRGGWGMKETDIFELAEYFPGGGPTSRSPSTRPSAYSPTRNSKGGRHRIHHGRRGRGGRRMAG